MGSKPVTVSDPSATGTFLAKRKTKQGILVLQGEAEVKRVISLKSLPEFVVAGNP